MRLVALIAALGILAALALSLTHGAPKTAYDNGELILQPVVLKPGQEACQLLEYVPSDTDRVRAWVSTAGKPGGPLEVTASRRGRVLARGGTRGGYRDSPVDLKLTGNPRETKDATVCIRNTSGIQVGVMGAPSAGESTADEAVARELHNVQALPGAAVDGRAYSPSVRMRLVWRRPGEESWLGFAPTLAERSSFVKPSFVGEWTFWAALVAVLVSGLAAVALVVREVRG